MEEIRCFIIDDEIEACDRLERLLSKFRNVRIVGKETNAEIGIKESIRLFPDIVFLDVEMPGKNGFEVIKAVQAGNVTPTFIFVTAYNQYAIKAIRNSAFDYLLKPVDIDELKETLKRYTNSQKQKQNLILPEKLRADYSLTEREIEIIKLLLDGKSSKEIGETLYISMHTVNTHRRNILEKTRVRSTSELLNLVSNFRS